MVTLIVEPGTGSIHYYSTKLVERVGASEIHADVYWQDREERTFNVPWVSLRTVSAFKRDLTFIHQLRKLKGTLHFPYHHLGRYGNFIRNPFIITVHDLIRYLDLSKSEPLIHRPNSRDRFYLRLDYKGVRKAKHVIAVSNATKSDLVKHLSIPEERISVVYEGVDHSVFYPARRSLTFPYVLYVGSEQPRKNLPVLLRAFRILKGDSRFRSLKLVKVGTAGSREADFRGATLKVINNLGVAGEVVFTGRVSEEELRTYYSNAACLAFPSIYEGFGLPLLEAMACGCPVVASVIPSTLEVVGDAGWLVDPSDAEAFAEAISSLLGDEKLRQSFVERGLRRANGFSWDKAAEETREVYRLVESQGPY